MIKIIAFGDTDTTSDASSIMAQMVKEPNVDVFLGLGDYPYAGRSTKWCSMVDQHFTPELKGRLMLNQGNHEDEESETEASQQDIEKWVNDHNSKHPQYKMDKLDITPPEANGGDSTWEKPTWLTSRQVGNVYIINMNTQDMDVEFKRNQYNWVLAEINKAKQLKAEGKIDWIINTAHKPWFTLKSSHSPYTAVRKIYSDLFKDVVDFNLHGHNHNTQLWLPMVADDTSGNGTGTQLFTYASDGKTFDFTKSHGWLTIVSGHAGHEHNGIKETGNKNCMWFNDTAFGYTVIEIDGKKAHVIAKDETGDTMFEYFVTKEGGTPDDNPLAKLLVPSQVAVGSTVTLDGSQSVADTLTITQTLGTPVNLTDAGKFKKSFVVPDANSIMAAGNFALGFQAVAQKGTKQSIAQVSIQVTTTDPADPPVAKLTAPTSAIAGSKVILNANGSTNYDSLVFSQISGPNVLIEPLDALRKQFNAPNTPTQLGFELKAIKGTQQSTAQATIQINSESSTGETKLIPISVAASGQDLGKEASKAADGNFESRWSCDGDGEWIEFKFDKVYPITKVKLTCYHYDKTYKFEIKGKQFENPAGRPVNSLVEYDLKDLNIISDTVRIIGHGNNLTTYNSFREIEFYSGTADPRHCQPGWHWDDTLKRCIPDLEPPINPNNKPPVANAGQDQTVAPKSTVTLNGLASSDPDGTISSYSWTQLSGPTVSISNANTAVASFIAPDLDTPQPQTPIAVITPNTLTGLKGSTLTVSGTSSQNASTYKWVASSGNSISGSSTNSTANIVLSGTVGSNNSVTLTVTNSTGQTNSVTKTINITTTPSTELDAEAEALILAKVGETVLLKDNGSKGAITRHEWLKETPDAQAIQLIANSSAKFGAKFIATSNMVDKDIRFRLRVFDAQNNFNDDITGTKVSITAGTPSGGFGQDAFGMKMLLKPTGKKIAMEWGTDHENGQRFNVNHEFHNYIMQGYFKLGSGQDAINHKGDGPNHGGCTSTSNFICLWYELHLELSTGKGELQYEFPHPKNNNVDSSKLELSKSIGKLNAGQWIGWATAYYWGADGYRHIKAFVDPNPFPNNDPNQKPLNNWDNVVYAVERGQIVPNITMPRDLQKVIDSDAGFESEIRMNNANSGTTDMKNVWVMEVDPKVTGIQPLMNQTINWQVLPDKSSKERRALDEERDRELGINDDIKPKKIKEAITTALPKDLLFQLRVTDNKGSSSTDTVKITVSDSSLPPPPDDVDAKFPELLAKATPGSTFVLDGSQSTGNITSWNIKQDEGPTVQLLDNPKKCSKQFTMPNEKVKFTLTVSNSTKSNSDTITVNPDDEQPTGDILYDSNIHGKWNDGNKRTVDDKEGNQSPDGKGFHTAASGNPRFIIDGDGVGHLEADSGHGRIYILAKNYNSRLEFDFMFEDENIDNISFKLRSRHQEGSDCKNRFGGFGGAIDRAGGEIDFQTESCHNEHENKIAKPIPPFQTGTWHKAAISVWDKPDKSAVNLKAEIDGKEVLTGEHKNPQPYYVDEAKFMEQSYFWLRINNSKTGKVAFKNVRLIKI
jgi:hypothetical protein